MYTEQEIDEIEFEYSFYDKDILYLNKYIQDIFFEKSYDDEWIYDTEVYLDSDTGTGSDIDIILKLAKLKYKFHKNKKINPLEKQPIEECEFNKRMKVIGEAVVWLGEKVLLKEEVEELKKEGYEFARDESEWEYDSMFDEDIIIDACENEDEKPWDWEINRKSYNIHIKYHNYYLPDEEKDTIIALVKYNKNKKGGVNG